MLVRLVSRLLNPKTFLDVKMSLLLDAPSQYSASLKKLLFGSLQLKVKAKYETVIFRVMSNPIIYI